MTGRADGADRWTVWGTYAYVATSEPRHVRAARRVADRLLAEIDRACSRFRADSDLSAANARPGRWVAVDPLLVAAVRVAVTAAEQTDGLVDPCLGRTLVSLGYDTDLRTVVDRAPVAAAPLVAPRPGAWREIGVADDAVRVPDGVALDLGATAKAWAADLLAATLVESLGCPVVVSLGGDVRVLGPEGRPDDPAATWPVQLAEHPDDRGAGPVVTVAGGLATSSTVARRWRTAAGVHHHLLDPRDGRPVREVFRTVTAAGRSCVAANTASTAALVLGHDAPEWLADRWVSARLVAADGAVRTVGAWPADPLPEEALR